MLEYALLGSDGRLGRSVTVGAVQGETNQLALNDRGEFAAVGATGEGGYGLPVPRPVVVVCDAAGRCASRVLTLGTVRGAAHMLRPARLIPMSVIHQSLASSRQKKPV